MQNDKSTSILNMRDTLKTGTKLSLTINTLPFVSEPSFSYKSCPQTLSNVGRLPVVALLS